MRASFSIFLAISATASAHVALRAVPAKAPAKVPAKVAAKAEPAAPAKVASHLQAQATTHVEPPVETHAGFKPPTAVNHKNDETMTSDWGNEYGPSDAAVMKAMSNKKKNMPPSDVEHKDGKSHPEDWQAEYENPQSETKWTGKVGDTHYYDSAAPHMIGFATICALLAQF